jgi:hypothetical protein
MMMLRSGRSVTTTENAPTLEDIALGLSQIVRFGGQTLFEWTVAHHSLVVMRIAERYYGPEMPLLPLHLLLHDAHECLTSDIPRDFKTAEMSKLQEELDWRIYAELGVLWPTYLERTWVKYIDNVALLAEAQVVTPPATYEAILDSLRPTYMAPAYDEIVTVKAVLGIEDVEEAYISNAQFYLARAHELLT